ncbi:MAG: ABC transporter permease [Lachnospiraceae bacterium]|nr:ABC transporter permease [Lachnospiraceae bacterium]
MGKSATICSDRLRVRKNRVSSVSIMSAALIASLFLSMLCSFFYNMWVYDVEAVVLEEGDWQARIAGTVSEEELNLIRSFGNVERAVVNEEAAEQKTAVIDLYFHNPRTIYQDMTLMSEKIGLESERITFNYQLLSMYFIRIPGDDKPRMILPLFATIMMIAGFSLILVIHNSFAVTMNAKIHQLGILSSVGATPRQIRISLIQEAAAMCVLPIIGGSLVGIGIGYGLLMMMNVLAAQTIGRHDVTFQYHPLIFVLTVFASMLTVLISAWIPARKLAKMTPLEAIRGAEEMQLRKRKHSPILYRLFGIEGELAGNALKAQKKALRTSTISLTLAFLGFAVMVSFFELSNISTEYTYFARYKDVWDVMTTVKDVRIEDVESIAALQEAAREEGASSSVIYQKATAVAQIPTEKISEEVRGIGGIERLTDGLTIQEKGYLVQASIVILDDEGFLEYCEQLGIIPRLDGVVILNRIWDSVNSNFRYPEYIPYVKEDYDSTVLYGGEQQGDESNIAITVLAYTDKEPVLREEYDDYALVHVMPLSLWKDISARIGQSISVEPDVNVRILMDREDNASMINQDTELLPQINRIEEIIAQILGQKYDIETENRIQEKLTNDRMLWGYQLIGGVFCSLLALIGIANVFSYTMGFMRVRRRECARYLSVGMTPDGLKKMFRIEMLVIAGRPIMITLPITVAVLSLMIKASYLNPAEFWSRAPYAPIAIYMAAIFGFVAIAYAIGGRKILHDNLVEALRNEAMM